MAAAALIAGLVGVAAPASAAEDAVPVPVPVTGTVLLGAPTPYPLDGGKVELTRADGAVVSVGSTVADGSYTVAAPGPGDYRIQFTPFGDAAVYQPQYLGSTADPAKAQIVTVKAGEPQSGLNITLPLGGGQLSTIARIGGADRYETAMNVSKSHWTAGSADTVWIVTGENYPDALSAGPAAIAGNDPILLTQGNTLPDAVKNEIVRLGASKVIVVGGPVAVSDTVFKALTAVVPHTERITGSDRFEVSREVARYAFSDNPAQDVFVATGTNYPDALAAGAVAGPYGAPVVLVNGPAPSLDAETTKLLTELGADSITIAGGPNAVSPQIETQLAATAPTTRVSGADRYEVAANLNKDAVGGSPLAYLVTGEKFPDALTGAASAGGFTSPLYLAHPDCVPEGAIAAMQAKGIQFVILIGGTDSLTANVEAMKPC
jgi:putative cell wall-binding protein